MNLSSCVSGGIMGTGGESMVIEETTCKSGLTKSGIPGISWSLNPYIGCAHRCVYCYASFMTKFHPGGAWGTLVRPKVNIAERVHREIWHGRKPREGTVLLSSATDAYQPAEGDYRLTRGCLEVLRGSGLEVSVLTKGDLVLRDTELLIQCNASVGFTITSPDDMVSLLLEPGAPPTSRRLAAARALSEAGIKTWVFIAPAFPWLVRDEQALKELVRMCRLAGVNEFMVDPMNLYPEPTARLMRAVRGRRDLSEPLEEALRDRHAYIRASEKAAQQLSRPV